MKRVHQGGRTRSDQCRGEDGVAQCRCGDGPATDGHFPLRLEQSGGYGAACPGRGGDSGLKSLYFSEDSPCSGAEKWWSQGEGGGKGPCLKVSTALAPAQAPGKDLVAQAG